MSESRPSETELPDPERVADELKDISRKLDGYLSQDQHGWLNAADHYLRYELGDSSE